MPDVCLRDAGRPDAVDYVRDTQGRNSQPQKLAGFWRRLTCENWLLKAFVSCSRREKNRGERNRIHKEKRGRALE